MPLADAVKAREGFKKPLRVAYARQMELARKDCKTVQGQQPYNICMGEASEAAERDFAEFYNNLQMLCRNESELRTLQDSERNWAAYKDSAIKAARAAWPEWHGGIRVRESG